MEDNKIRSSEQLLKQAELLVKTVGIPSQPSLVQEIFYLIDMPDISLKKIAGLIAKDVGLTAKLLKTANSPYFGAASKIESVGHALSFIGLENFYELIFTEALKEAMQSYLQDNNHFSIFWKHSMEIAAVGKMLTEKFSLGIGDELTSHYVYLAGLFHDCAIPLLMKKFDNYISLMGMPISNNMLITNDESIHFYTTHSLAGYLVAKSWKLPDAVCNAIRFHHDKRLIDSEDWVSGRLIDIIFVAEHIWQDSRTDIAETELGNMSDSKWYDELYVKVFGQVLQDLSIEENDLEDFALEVYDVLKRGV